MSKERKAKVFVVSGNDTDGVPFTKPDERLVRAKSAANAINHTATVRRATEEDLERLLTAGIIIETAKD